MLEVIVCSGLLLAFYQFLLARKVPYRAARRFLLASALLSVVIPALHLPILPAETVYLQIPMGAEQAGISIPAAETATAPIAATVAFPWRELLATMYGAVALLLLAILVRNLVRIRRLRLASRLTPLRDYTLAEHPDVQSPFSFWRTIFLLREERPDANQRAMIVAHEAAHIRHRHSRDKVALGVLKALCWFNPFFWMMERMLSEVQEYEADEDVLRAGYSVDNYRLAIFKQLFGYYPDLTSGLSHSITKKRFTMMNQAPRGSLSWLRLSAALPLFAGLLFAFGATARTISSDPQGPDQAQSVQEDTPPTIDITIPADGSQPVLVNGQPVALAELGLRVNALRGDAQFITVNLKGNPKASMGLIDDVKNELRKVRALRINFQLPGEQSVKRHLPPHASDPIFQPLEAQSVDRNNLMFVRINSKDKVWAGSEEVKSDLQFLNRCKTFVREHKPNGIFILQSDRGTSYEKYYAVQKLVQQAVDEIRDEEARSSYGKAYADLQPAEQDAIKKAVPLSFSEAESKPAKR